MEHVEVLQRMANESWRGSPEHAALTAAIAALSAPQPPAEAHPVYEGTDLEGGWVRRNPPPSAPVGMDAAAVEAGHITFESMKQCADSWLAVVDTLNTVAPGWSEKEGTGRECATATIAALAQQTAAHPAITHCDNRGCDWLDNGLNPAACPCCKQPAAVDEATRRDAERYRWLRAIPESVRADHERNPANGGWDAPFYWPGSAAGEELQGRDLDAAIDAAVQQEACHA